MTWIDKFCKKLSNIRGLTYEEVLQIAFSRKWLRCLITPLLTNNSTHKYIFILGCYSSGTTLLNHLLSYHPEISALKVESATLTGELITPEELGWARMIHPCLGRLRESLTEADITILKRHWTAVHDKTKPFFLEKSISNWTRIDWLKNKFEGAWFIWIIRNGYAVSEGLRRRSMESPNYTAKVYPQGFPIELCAKEWVAANENIEESFNFLDNGIVVRYEDLTTDTGTTLNRIVNILPFEAKNFEYSKIFTFHKKERIIENLNQESLLRLSDKDILGINNVAANRLSKLGYDLLESRN